MVEMNQVSSEMKGYSTVKVRVDAGPQSFLHMERRKRDLTLSLSFSVFLIRGNFFRVAI